MKAATGAALALAAAMAMGSGQAGALETSRQFVTNATAVCAPFNNLETKNWIFQNGGVTKSNGGSFAKPLECALPDPGGVYKVSVALRAPAINTGNVTCTLQYTDSIFGGPAITKTLLLGGDTNIKWMDFFPDELNVQDTEFTGSLGLICKIPENDHQIGKIIIRYREDVGR